MTEHKKLNQCMIHSLARSLAFGMPMIFAVLPLTFECLFSFFYTFFDVTCHYSIFPSFSSL